MTQRFPSLCLLTYGFRLVQLLISLHIWGAVQKLQAMPCEGRWSPPKTLDLAPQTVLLWHIWNWVTKFLPLHWGMVACRAIIRLHWCNYWATRLPSLKLTSTGDLYECLHELIAVNVVFPQLDKSLVSLEPVSLCVLPPFVKCKGTVVKSHVEIVSK